MFNEGQVIHIYSDCHRDLESRVTGCFLAWSMTSEYEDGYWLTKPVALIMNEDGLVSIVPVSCIQFLDFKFPIEKE